MALFNSLNDGPISFLAKGEAWPYIWPIEHDVVIESLTPWFIEIGMRSSPSWSQNQPTTQKIYCNINYFPLISWSMSMVGWHPFLDACLRSKQLKRHRKQDAAHEPECSYVEHFCVTSFSNSLVHFSPVTVLLDCGMRKRVGRKVWNLKCGVWSVVCKV